MSVLLLVAGCGSRDTGAADTSASRAPVHSSTTPTQTATSSDDDSLSSDGQGEFEASLGQGDEVEIGVDFGQPEPRASVSNPTVAACDDEIDAERSVVIPVRLTGEVTSSLESTIAVDPMAGWLSQSDEADIYWAADFSDAGPTCNTPTPNGSVFGVVWHDVQPGASRNLSAYVILDGALTPDDPTGADLTNSFYVLPRIGINGDMLIAGTGTVSGSGDRVMRCDGVANMGITVAAFLDRDVALSHGCTSPTS